MVTINDITDAIVDQLEEAFAAVSGAPVIHVEGDLFAIAETPYVTIFPTGANGLDTGLATFGELEGGIPFAIGIRTGSAASTEAVRLLKDLMDDEHDLSVVAALDSDTTLGGVATDISWGDGWPWSGISDFPSANGDGLLVGSNMAIVVIKARS